MSKFIIIMKKIESSPMFNFLFQLAFYGVGLLALGFILGNYAQSTIYQTLSDVEIVLGILACIPLLIVGLVKLIQLIWTGNKTIFLWGVGALFIWLFEPSRLETLLLICIYLLMQIHKRLHEANQKIKNLSNDLNK